MELNFSLAICGWLADRLSSRRFALLIGLIALAGSTALLCVGTSIAILIIARILQGFSTAFVWVVAMALLVDTVDPAHIGKDMGYVGTVSAIGTAAGPLLGGVVYAKGGYYAVFAMAFALLGFDIVLRLLLIEKNFVQLWEGDSVPSAVEVARAECLRLNSISLPDEEKVCTARPSSVGEQGGQAMKSEAPSAVSGPRPYPAVVELLASRRLLAALWAVFVSAILYNSFDTVLPLFAHRTFNWYSTGSGLLFLPIIAPQFLSPLLGWVSDKYGAKYPTALGFLSTLPGLVMLRLVTHNTVSQVVLLCGLLALVGLGLTLAFTPLMAEIAYVVEATEKARPGIFGAKGAYAQAYGLYNVAWAGGQLVGPIWSGYVELEAGWGTMAWSLGALGGITAVPTLLYMGSSSHASTDSRENL